MLTIRAEIKKGEQKNDGTYNVKLRFTLDRKIKRISTSLFVYPSDLSKSGELKKNSALYNEVEKLVISYREKCNAMQVDINGYTLDDIFKRLEFEELKKKDLDFLEFCRGWIRKATIKGAANYTTAVNSFETFIGKKKVSFKNINRQLLQKYMAYLIDRRDENRRYRVLKGKRITTDRTVSMYLGALRHLYHQAMEEYNDYDAGLLLLPTSPFTTFHIPKQEVTRKRALTKRQLLQILELPYKEVYRGTKATCRFDMAKDCFILSFCLMGMNSVDLFNAVKCTGTYIIYNRTKTMDRRQDKAEMRVRIPEMARKIMRKYADNPKERVFVFHRLYCDYKAFNKALNKGLKEIGAMLGIEDLEFYAARHSWATLAINKVGIDKYTVHSALNHTDASMKVTDMYIQRDFVVENEANRKVLEYVFGKDTY